MAIREIYDKDSKTVSELEREVHKTFVDDLMAVAEGMDVNTSKLTIMVGGSPALTNRMKNPNENMTLKTMTRYAAALGKKLKIELVDSDEIAG